MSAPAEEEVDLTGVRVLVVDDNASAREIFMAMLKSLKFEAVSADCGEVALVLAMQARVQGRPFGLVLMDWQMPEMNGLETIERMRADAGGAAQPAFVLVTAYNRDQLIEQCGPVAVDAILSKPVSSSSLLDTIASVLGKELASCRRVRREADYRQAQDAVRGAYLLLVEDNEVNQEVAQEILSAAGIRVDIATNGAMALAKVAVVDYDGVLMDCQMPVMDGFDATRKLRENPRLATLPVIAMTANAMVGDKERCLESGMNDFIAKPIDVGQLFTTLARWVHPANPQAPVVAVAQANDDVLPVIAGLRMESALARVGGSTALMRKLLIRFAETQRDAVHRIGAAIDSNDLGAATREAHTIKGLAGNIGAPGVADVAAALEQMLGQGDLASLEQVLGELAIELDDLVSRIDHALGDAGRPQPAAPAQFDLAALAPAMRDMAALLAQDDAEAIKRVDQVCALLFAAGQTDAARQLKRLIGQYDFEGALEPLTAAAAALNISLEAKEAS